MEDQKQESLPLPRERCHRVSSSVKDLSKWVLLPVASGYWLPCLPHLVQIGPGHYSGLTLGGTCLGSELGSA